MCNSAKKFWFRIQSYVIKGKNVHHKEFEVITTNDKYKPLKRTMKRFFLLTTSLAHAHNFSEGDKC